MLFSSVLYIFKHSISNVCNLFYAGISVKVKGEANTCWATEKQEMDERGQYRDETQTVTAHEEYFETKYYLVGSASGKATLFTHQ